MSAEAGFVSNVRVLLQHSASLVALDRNGLTALDLAERGQHDDCVSILQQAASKSIKLGNLATAGCMINVSYLPSGVPCFMRMIRINFKLSVFFAK